ncbi:signal peptidase II family protein [Propionibacterium sp. 409-HC1]|nr:signal peptidase II family protein [Propionibacterium sp. 409-HC1]
MLVGGQLKRWRVVMVAIGVLGYGLDQWTKAEAVARLDPYDPPSWFGGFLTLRLIRNPGAAFSMGSTATVLISLFAIAMLIAVCVWGCLALVIVGLLLPAACSLPGSAAI